MDLNKKMGAERAILGIAPTMQSLALLGGLNKLRRRKKKKLGSFVEGAAGILVGVPLIGETSNAIGGM